MIIRIAQESPRIYRGLAGMDRAMLYAVACVSGLRASELAILCPEHFDLAGEPPTITLGAEYTKNGKTVIQPLPSTVAESLRSYLSGRPSGCPVWQGSWPEKAAEMLREDLEVAGIAYVIDGPNGPLYADFHALRHSYIALLDQAGVSLKQAMQLARHSDPKLTMARYGRAQLHDLATAVNGLPSIVSPRASSVPAEQRATGTNHAPNSESLRSACASNDAPCESIRRLDMADALLGRLAHLPEALNMQELENNCELLIPIDKNSGDWDRTSDTRLMKPLL